jgi:hypothetical protein
MLPRSGDASVVQQEHFLAYQRGQPGGPLGADHPLLLLLDACLATAMPSTGGTGSARLLPVISTDHWAVASSAARLREPAVYQLLRDRVSCKTHRG